MHNGNLRYYLFSVVSVMIVPLRSLIAGISSLKSFAFHIILELSSTVACTVRNLLFYPAIPGTAFSSVYFYCYMQFTH